MRGEQSAEFYDLLFDPAINILRVIPIRTDEKEVSGVVEVIYEDIRASTVAPAHDWAAHCPQLACFVTAWARLKLYDLLEKAGAQAMYCDTDSLIYRVSPSLVERNEHVLFKSSNQLGQAKDELDGDDIIEFASGGPKNYAYLTRGGIRKSVVKGIRPSALLPDFQLKFLKACVLAEGLGKPNDGPAPHIVRSQSLVRDRVTQEIRSQAATYRVYRMVNGKVKLFADGTTLPFGHKDIEAKQRLIEEQADRWNRELDAAVQEAIQQRKTQMDSDRLPGEEEMKVPDRGRQHQAQARMADRMASQIHQWRHRLDRDQNPNDYDIEYNEVNDEWMMDM